MRARMLAVVAAGPAVFLTGCNTTPADQPAEVVQPVATPAARPAPSPPLLSPPPSPAPPPTPDIPDGPSTFLFDGKLTQGGWIRGQAPGGAVSAKLGEQELALDPEGYFFAAFDRDAGPAARLVATTREGRNVESPLSISARDWNIERVNVARRSGGASESFMRRRRPELERIYEARAENAVSSGWNQDFVWPVTGRISGRFGSQRIYRGEPGSYHSGIDIATGESGTPFVAPADGVVTLATSRPFSLEGLLLIIDHGQGLNSAFLHMSKIAVSEGDVVRQGQYIGNIGSSGRATGPHLHWGLKWRDARLDPLLFTGPMP